MKDITKNPFEGKEWPKGEGGVKLENITTPLIKHYERTKEKEDFRKSLSKSTRGYDR